MDSASQPLTIAVLGATGNQGRGVIRALLAKSSPLFHIRGITRDPNSPAARHLIQELSHNDRLQLVTADVYDPSSLDRAFAGVHGVFAMIEDGSPKRKIEFEDHLKHVLKAGRNILDAAKSCRVQHLVFSSLPNLTSASNSSLTKVFHFDYKHEVAQWMLDELPDTTTILYPAYFFTNLFWQQYCRREADGTVRFCSPVPGDTWADWVDPGYDIGIFAAEVFALGPQKTKTKVYPIVGRKIRFDEMAKVFERVTGQKAVFEPTTLDEWGAVVSAGMGKGFEEDARQMMEWTAVAPREKICYGTMDPAEDTSWEDLGVKVSSFEEWIRRSGWSGPK